MTSNSARSCRPIAAWMFWMTIDFSCECKRLFLCTKLSPLLPSQFSIKGTKSAAAYLKRDAIWGAAAVPLRGQRSVLCSVPDNWIYSRDARQRERQARSPVSELPDDDNDPETGCRRTLLRCRPPVDHFGDPHECFRIEPNAVGLPAFLTESQRHFKGLRAIWRRQTRWRSALVCLDKNRAQALSHEHEHSTSAPRSYNIGPEWTCASRSNIWLMALLAPPLNGRPIM
jgi:hypothetical protein